MKSKEEIERLAKEEYPSIIGTTQTGVGYDMNAREKEAYIKGYNQCQNDMLQDQKVTRFEVIDETGRVYSKRNCNIELSYQDDGRTLKVFIKNENKQ